MRGLASLIHVSSVLLFVGALIYAPGAFMVFGWPGAPSAWWRYVLFWNLLTAPLFFGLAWLFARNCERDPHWLKLSLALLCLTTPFVWLGIYARFSA